MEKRLFFAITLSMLVLLTWSIIFKQPQPVDNKALIQKTSPSERKLTAPVAQPQSTAVSTPISMHTEELENKDLKLIFNLENASIREAVFKKYKDTPFFLGNGFSLQEPGINFQRIPGTRPEELVFLSQDDKRKILKRFSFDKPNYSIVLEIKVTNISPDKLDAELFLTLASLNLNSAKERLNFLNVVTADKNGTGHFPIQRDKAFQDIDFIAIRDRYFAAIVGMQEGSLNGAIKKVNNLESQVNFAGPETILMPGQIKSFFYHIYLGPQELHLINAVNPKWAGIVNYGFFDVISHVLLQTLEYIYKIVKNWGWAVVILSALVYLVLFPLSIKQIRSMKEMQMLQPKIEQLRQAYKDNPQKLNKAIMELYREHKINPLGGCLPMILQIPIFFALYQALMRFVPLKGATFLWIKDLSEPDRLFSLPFPKPFDAFNLLPILMTIGMFIQQKLSSQSTSTGSAEQQKIMLIMFPLLFGFIFYNMPSALVLYWFINSILMLVFQLRVAKAQ